MNALFDDATEVIAPDAEVAAWAGYTHAQEIAVAVDFPSPIPKDRPSLRRTYIVRALRARGTCGMFLHLLQRIRGQ